MVKEKAHIPESHAPVNLECRAKLPFRLGEFLLVRLFLTISEGTHLVQLLLRDVVPMEGQIVNAERVGEKAITVGVGNPVVPIVAKHAANTDMKPIPKLLLVEIFL